MKAHRTDSLSLFFGLVFLLIAAGYVVTAYSDFELPEVGWFIAGGLIFLGVVGAITALIPSRKGSPDPVTAIPGETATEPFAEEPPVPSGTGADRDTSTYTDTPPQGSPETYESAQEAPETTGHEPPGGREQTR